MNAEIISDLELILKNQFKKGVKILLHELLWSIDAKHRPIPNLEELNEALNNSGIFKINRNGNQIEIIPSKSSMTIFFVENDISKAMEYYNLRVSNLSKSIGRKKNDKND